MNGRAAIRIASFSVGFLSIGTLQAKAQDLSSEADQAFWCGAAYANYVKKDAFTSPEQQAAALTDMSRLERALAADAVRLGWQQSDVESLALGYDEEVGH